MIRKLKSGEYRLYSRKPDAKTHKRKNLAPSRPGRRLRNTSVRCSTSSITRATQQTCVAAAIAPLLRQLLNMFSRSASRQRPAMPFGSP